MVKYWPTATTAGTYLEGHEDHHHHQHHHQHQHQHQHHHQYQHQQWDPHEAKADAPHDAVGEDEGEEGGGVGGEEDGGGGEERTDHAGDPGAHPGDGLVRRLLTDLLMATAATGPVRRITPARMEPTKEAEPEPAWG